MKNKDVKMGIGFVFLAVMLVIYTIVAAWTHHLSGVVLGTILSVFCASLGYTILSSEYKPKS